MLFQGIYCYDCLSTLGAGRSGEMRHKPNTFSTTEVVLFLVLTYKKESKSLTCCAGIMRTRIA